jgi:hypothetical protein
MSLHSLDPGRRYPLGFTLQLVDFVEKLLVGPLGVIVNDDHVEEVAVPVLHLTRLLDDVL